jgi:hypothetical protein
LEVGQLHINKMEKMKKFTKNKILFVELFFIGLIMLGVVSAAGIVSPYWQDYPLQMNYGEAKIINFTLQNMVGNKDITVDVKISKGSDITTLDKTTYTAKAGTSGTLIPITIKIPQNYDKQIQTVELEIKTVNGNAGGMVSLGVGWTPSFNVVVSEKPVQKSTWVGIIVGLILIIIILAAIIFIVIYRRRK